MKDILETQAYLSEIWIKNIKEAKKIKKQLRKRFPNIKGFNIRVFLANSDGITAEEFKGWMNEK